MDLELVKDIFEVCIIPLLGLLTKYLISWLNKKNKQLETEIDNELFQKYFNMTNETIHQCVIAMNQTYVNSLKNQNKFDSEAQKKAFSEVYKNVMNILGEEAVVYLNNAVGDLNAYITSRIENEVKENKE